MIGVRCTSSLIYLTYYLAYGSNLVDGNTLGQLGFMKLFLASSHGKSSPARVSFFLSFFSCHFFVLFCFFCRSFRSPCGSNSVGG